MTMTEIDGGDNPTDRNTKNFSFKDLDPEANSDMVVDSTPTLRMSWREKVLGQGISGSGWEKDLEFLGGDITRTIVNGIPTINFSERVQQILVRDMASTVLVKLLDRSLSYTLLQHRTHTL